MQPDGDALVSDIMNCERIHPQSNRALAADIRLHF
jgi:hypothetical protein